MKLIKTIVQDGHYNAFPGLCRTSDGNLFLCYRRGNTHASENGVIVGQIGTQGNTAFGPNPMFGAAFTAVSDPVYDVRDPNVALLADGSLLMVVFRYNVATSQAVDICISRSYTKGVSWTALQSIGNYSVYGAESAPPVQLPNGNILIVGYGQDTSGVVSTKVIQSTDNGVTWATIGVVTTDGVTTPVFEGSDVEVAIRLHSSGVMLATIRNQTTAMIATATSVDQGHTWTAPVDKFAGGSVARMIEMSDASVLAAYRDPNGNLAIRRTCDLGATWSTPNTLTLQTYSAYEYGTFIDLGGEYFGFAFASMASSTDSAMFWMTARYEEFLRPQDVALSSGLLSAVWA